MPCKQLLDILKNLLRKQGRPIRKVLDYDGRRVQNDIFRAALIMIHIRILVFND